MAESLTYLAFLCCFYLSTLLFSHASDSILPNHSLSDGNFFVSSDGAFEMGFFSPNNSKNRYFGIWYKISTCTVVWVANRDSPLNDTSGALTLTQDGNLIVLNATNGNVFWSSRGNYNSNIHNPEAQLLATGNLVIRDANDENPENYLWQSFDHPSDTVLPGMKIGKNLVTGLDRVLRSWKNSDDPSTGNYSFLVNSNGFPQLLLMGSGSAARFRYGPWNGETFSGASRLNENKIYKFEFVINQEEMYYIFDLINSSVFSRLVLNQMGNLQRLSWNHKTQVWTASLTRPDGDCDKYGICHGYGICDNSINPICSCLDKFKPKKQEDWDSVDWSGGCVRKTPLNCKNDGFVRYSGVKLPDTRNSWYNKNMNLEECEKMCMKNCSCVAYANIDIRGEGSGCLLWFEDLMDIKNPGESGQDIYIRMASSELGSSGQKAKIIRVCLTLLAVILLLGLILTLYKWKKQQKRHKEGTQRQQELTREGTLGGSSRQTHRVESNMEDLELPVFDLVTILNATNYFSPQNKIGEGGFGPVYKGTLQGQEIAVKRLSKYSTQGLNEFKNEVILFAKLQHRNLVRLLGCCIDGEEKMLIYEFMPNNSLETFIFDENQRKLLDWPCRFRIINGIARGLLYLHQDSRLRIIHRDLKASNILLDEGMNSKISDFGMARSFGGSETEANTRRVVGTFGYMSPEYAVDGNFSVKSDVFSFEVLVLEIISGTRNRGFFHPDHHHNLIGHAWILHKEGRSLELIDTHLSKSVHVSEILRYIHVSLLCTQQFPEDRPSMSNVVLMLGSDGALPKPKEPGFFTERNLFYEAKTLSIKRTESSRNELSITIMEAR